LLPPGGVCLGSGNNRAGRMSREGLPFIVIQAGSQDVAMRKLKNVKKDFASLGNMLKGSGVQVVFSSVLLNR